MPQGSLLHLAYTGRLQPAESSAFGSQRDIPAGQPSPERHPEDSLGPLSDCPLGDNDDQSDDVKAAQLKSLEAKSGEIKGIVKEYKDQAAKQAEENFKRAEEKREIRESNRKVVDDLNKAIKAAVIDIRSALGQRFSREYSKPGPAVEEMKKYIEALLRTVLRSSPVFQIPF